MTSLRLKKAISLLLCVCAALSLAPFASVTAEDGAGYAFEERLLYGGTAVDVGDMIYLSQDGRVYRRGIGEEELHPVAEYDAKYLNYARGKLWFIAGNEVISCGLDGSGAEVFRRFGGAVSHLYVSDGDIFVLCGESVLRLDESGDSVVFSREGIAGFIPEGDGFRWISPNPDYVPVECEGDEIYCEAPAEFITHTVGPDGKDVVVRGEECRLHTGGEAVSSVVEYTGPYVTVGETTLPLEEHMPGSFFTKNGQACACHHTSSTYCVESVGNCNCMRYYPTGYKETCEVDLLGAQCFAFARMVFYRCFGFIDHSMNSSLYYNVGTISRGGATANTVRELLMKAAPGAHVRLSSGHSVSILTMDDDFLVIYHGNAGGDGVASAPCVVSTRRYTWEQFASAAAAGISFVNMPYNYPGTSIKLTGRPVGYYRLASALNLRSEPDVGSESLASIPINEILLVTETEGFWGRTEYAGETGWIFLEYARFYSLTELSPSEAGGYTMGEDGFITGTARRRTTDMLAESFAKQNISVVKADGSLLGEDDFVGTGCVIRLDLAGEVIDSAVFVLRGDPNGNGYIDIGDYVMLRREVIGSRPIVSEAARAAADVSGNGEVGTDDCLMIKRCLLGTYEIE